MKGKVFSEKREVPLPHPFQTWYQRVPANDGCSSWTHTCRQTYMHTCMHVWWHWGFTCQMGYSLPWFSQLGSRQCYRAASLKGQVGSVGSGVSVCVNKGKRGDVDSKSSSLDFWNVILSCFWRAVTPKARCVKMDLRDCHDVLLTLRE